MSNQPFPKRLQGHYTSLMKDLKQVDLQGTSIPCELVLNGDHAFPLVMNSKSQALMAASLYGRGKIVVLGHETYLTSCPALVEKVLTWLAGDNLSVAVQRNVKGVADNLKKSSLKAEVVGSFSDKPGVGVYVTDAYSVGDDPKDLVAFMKAGGGVLIGGQAWHWATKHRNQKVIPHFSGNKVSAVAGIYFTSTYGAAENIPVSPQIPSSWKALDLGKDFGEDLEVLLNGIPELDMRGHYYASEIMVHGPLAFPIGVTDEGQVYLAGAHYGRGRVIVVPHEYLLYKEELNSFWKNAYHWLDQGRNGVVGYVPDTTIFKGSGLKLEKTQFKKGLSVFVCEAYSDEHAKEILQFVAEGGGLVMGGHAWYFDDSAGNRILNKMGLTLLRDTITRDLYKTPVLSQAKLGAFHLLYRLQRFLGHIYEGGEFSDQEAKDINKLAYACGLFLDIKAYDSFPYTQILSSLTDMVKKFGVPEMNDVNSAKTPKDVFCLFMGTHLYRVSPNPGAILPLLFKEIPKFPVVSDQKIKISAHTEEYEDWISTGLYLPPGLRTNILIPEKIVNKKWEIQISCQSDNLAHKEELWRAPRVYERFPVTSEKIHVWNPWGGLIYLVAPPDTNVDEIEIGVEQAVTAPYYKSGVTTAAEWSVMRTAPAPWAEFEFDNVIITVPSRYIRDLESLEEVTQLWNDIMKAMADLAVIPHKFPRKERLVTDVQISLGGMHSGYPIMMHYRSAAEMFNPPKAKKEGLWGQIHELGHNQQRMCWEFKPYTGEATNNLWSVYVHEEVLKLDRALAHSSLTEENRKLRREKFVKDGRKLSDWTVWVALETYLQLQEKFGWVAWKKVFGAYHEMEDVPKDTESKMNLFAEVFSKTVGMDLTGFFKAWSWPIKPETEEKLSILPSWSDHPMAKYK